MKLPFSKKFKNGNETYFLEKIWTNQYLWTEDEAIEFATNKTHILEFDDWVIETCNPKIHTIRMDLKNRWKQGSKIHPVFENRTKNQHQFAPTFVCKGIQSIEITWLRGNIYISIDDKLFDYNQKVQLSQNDGFESLSDFEKWFNTPFKGKIIHFTDFKY